MSTSHKEKIIRVLQLFQTTDEKTPMNAVQISQKLEEEYGMENVHRTSIYDDVRLLQSCGYPIKQAENSHKGWYMEKHLLEDWEIKLMLDSVQQARCVSVHEANEIRKKLLNLTSQRGRSRFSHMIMPLPGNVRGAGRIGEYIEIMLEAMYLHKKIRFQYTEINNASGKRIHELELLKRTLQYHHGIIGRLRKHLSEKYQCEMDEHCTENVVNMMTNEFSMSAAKKTYAQCVFLKKEQDDYGISDVYGKMLQNPEFCAILEELVDFGISRYKVNYSYHYQDTNLVLYQKYTYEDACRLLNWERNEVPLNIGGYKYDKKTKTFPIFINYDKQDNISDTTKYEDHFVSENRLIAISKSGRSMDSEDVQNFLNATERGINVQLFVRKNKDDKISKEFYYLGRVIATGNAKQFVIPNTDKTAVEIEWELETPVREDIYQYIVNE